MTIDTTKENYPQCVGNELSFYPQFAGNELSFYPQCAGNELSFADGKVTGLVPTAEPNKMTNREWLQSLSDEEFVMKLCKSCKTCNTDCGYITTCNHGLLVWLKAEHN